MGRKDNKSLLDNILSSAVFVDNYSTGQNIDRLWTDHIRRSEISCKGYEIALNRRKITHTACTTYHKVGDQK